LHDTTESQQTNKNSPDKQHQQHIHRHWPDADTRVYNDTSTGTNTDRIAYKQLMENVKDGYVEAVVVHEVSRISRSVRDLSRIVDTLRQHNTGLHIVSEGLEFPATGDTDPYQKAMLQLLGVFAELEADMTQKRVREGIASRQAEDDYHHGPAPLGFDKEDGRLRENPEYDRVCTVLAMVDDGDMSQRQASKELGCGRKTVRNALDERRELYGL
jgi:DNA invertase Pin-like site-specific DNA recombinase